MSTKPFARLRTPILVRTAVYFTAGSFLILLAISYPEYNQAELESTLAKDEAMFRLSLAGSIATSELREVMGDLRTVAGRVVIEDYLRTPSATNRQRVERQFRDVAQNYHRYDQIRLLDLAGRERIRVNYRDGVATVVPPEHLQDQSARYYVDAARALKSGEIYLSALDLNIEEGAVERPLKPAIRVATLIFDETARPRAILIMSYLAARMLSRFQEVVGGTPGDAMLLNAGGYWLYASDPADQWGFALGHGASFAERYPAAWQHVASGETGIVEAPGGTFIYRTVHPQRLGFSMRTDEVWKSVIRLPDMPSASPLVAFRREPGLVAFLLLLTIPLSAVLAWLRTTVMEKRHALAQSERRLAEAQGLTHLGHWEWDLRRDAVTGSDEIYRILGRKPPAFAPTFSTFFETVHPDDRPEHADAIAAALGSDAPYATEYRIVRPDGEVRTIAGRGHVVRDEAGAPLRMLGTVQDITERKRVEAALYQREQEFRALAERSPDMVGRLDRNFRSLYANPAIERATGHPPAYFTGKDIRTLALPAEALSRWTENISIVFDTAEERIFEFHHPAPDGKEHFFSTHVVPEFSPEGRVETVITVTRDITALREAKVRLSAHVEQLEAANTQLALLSRQDALTGLANRRHLFTYLQDEWRRETRHARPLSMIMIDVDCFKEYNDNYGHLAGDECLRDIARALQSQVHRPGDLLARYGGEEFAVVLPETTLHGAHELAENLRHAVVRLNREHRYSHVAPHVTISIGVAELAPKGHKMDELILLADAALYRAKEEGRNRVAVSGKLAS